MFVKNSAKNVFLIKKLLYNKKMGNKNVKINIRRCKKLKQKKKTIKYRTKKLQIPL